MSFSRSMRVAISLSNRFCSSFQRVILITRFSPCSERGLVDIAESDEEIEGLHMMRKLANESSSGDDQLMEDYDELSKS